jgi:hypothetical protein
MGETRINFKAFAISMEPRNGSEIDINVIVHDSEIDEILSEIPLDKIYNHLEGADVLKPALFLKYCTLEEVFDEFNIADLKTRLAQYMIDK